MKAVVADSLQVAFQEEELNIFEQDEMWDNEVTEEVAGIDPDEVDRVVVEDQQNEDAFLEGVNNIVDAELVPDPEVGVGDQELQLDQSVFKKIPPYIFINTFHLCIQIIHMESLSFL